MMKRVILLFTLMIAIIFLSGCWNYNEIEESQHVAGLAIDKGENGYKYHVTAEVIDVSGDKESGLKTIIFDEEANTVFAALRKMITKSTQKLYIGHCELIIISEEVAREGITPIIDIIFRDHEFRLSLHVVIAKSEKASDFFTESAEAVSIVSFGINDALQNDLNFIANANHLRAYEIYNLLETDGISTVIPYIEPIQLGDEPSFKTMGISVFHGDSLVGFLNPIESNGLLYITDKIQGGMVPVLISPEENKYFSAEVFNSKTKMTPKFEENEIIMEIEVDTTVGINEMQDELEEYNEELDKTFTKEIEKVIENRIINAVDKVQNEFGTDVFGFGNTIKESDYSRWVQLRDNWDETFKNVKVQVKVKVQIRGIGPKSH